MPRFRLKSQDNTEIVKTRDSGFQSIADLISSLTTGGGNILGNLLEGGQNLGRSFKQLPGVKESVENIVEPGGNIALDLVQRPASAGGRVGAELQEAAQAIVQDFTGKGGDPRQMGVGQVLDTVRQARVPAARGGLAELLAPLEAAPSIGFEDVEGVKAERIPFEERALPESPVGQLLLALGIGLGMPSMVAGGARMARRMNRSIAKEGVGIRPGGRIDRDLTLKEQGLTEARDTLSKLERQVAQSMREELAGDSALFRQILDNGGLKVTGELTEQIPIFMRRKGGFEPNEMAAALGFEDTDAFLDALQREQTSIRGIADEARRVVRDGIDDPEPQLARVQSLRERIALRRKGPTNEGPVLPTDQGFKDVHGETIHVKPPGLFGDDVPVGTVTFPFARKVNQFKDLNRFEAGFLSTTDFVRAVKRMEGTADGEFRKSAVRPVEDANFNRIKELSETGEEFREVLGGIKSPTTLRAAIGKIKGDTGDVRSDSSRQIFLSIEQRNTRPLTTQEQKVESWMRDKYKELLSRINVSRVAVGLEPIPERPDYINHIWRNNLMDQVLGPHFIPELDALRSGSGRGRTPWTPFSIARKGKEGFEEDAVKAFQSYLGPALSNIHMLPPVEGARAYVRHLPKNARRFFTSWLDEGALGKEATIDKAVIRPVVEAIGALSSRVARNLIVGNLSTAALQLSSFPQVLSEAGFRNTAKATLSTVPGLGRLVPDIPKPTRQAEGLKAIAFTMGPGMEFAQKNSRVLQLRGFESFEDILPAGETFRGLERTLNIPLTVADRLTVAWSFNAGYLKARKELNLDHAAAVRYGDDFAGRTQAVYDRLYKSPVMRNRMVSSTIGQFQTWTNGMMNFLGYDLIGNPDIGRVEKLRRLGVFAGTAIGINNIYHMLGFDEPFDGLSTFVPFADVISVHNAPGFRAGDKGISFLLTGDPETRFEKFRGRAGAPAGFQVLGDVADDSFSLADDFLFNNATPSQRSARNDRLFKNIMRIAPPFGGNQAQKTLLGLRDVERGFSQIGAKQIPVSEQGPGLLPLGPTGTARAREIFEGSSRPSLRRFKVKEEEN